MSSLSVRFPLSKQCAVPVVATEVKEAVPVVTAVYALVTVYAVCGSRCLRSVRFSLSQVKIAVHVFFTMCGSRCLHSVRFPSPSRLVLRIVGFPLSQLEVMTAVPVVYDSGSRCLH